MNFTWLNKQGVRSDTGFELQRTARFAAAYREGERVKKLYVEGAGRALTIYESELQDLWDGIANPFERKKERDRIIANVRAALAFQGLDLDLVSGAVPSGPA
jgi:hypothetical protein